MTVGLSDGERVYAVRYASGPEANTLFVSSSVQDLRLLLPAEERFRHFSDEARVVVSEPLIDLPGLWPATPPSTALIVQDGPDHDPPFTPRSPWRTPASGGRRARGGRCSAHGRSEGAGHRSRRRRGHASRAVDRRPGEARRPLRRPVPADRL